METLVIKTMKLNKTFLLGLYLYVRQVELSIDRSLHVDWDTIVDYFADKTPIETLIKKLESVTTIELKDIPFDTVVKPKVRLRPLPLLLRKKYCLSDEELIYIYTQLSLLSKVMVRGASPKRKQRTDLRMSFSHCESILFSRLKPRDYKDKIYVEHYNQNPILRCKPLEELIGNDWL